jgi:hypothetical protein
MDMEEAVLNRLQYTDGLIRTEINKLSIFSRNATINWKALGR